MRVLILNKREFDEMMSYKGIDDNNVEDFNIMFISINNSQDDGNIRLKYKSPAYFQEDHSNVKTIYFGDYGEQQLGRNNHLFTDEQAEELYEFIKANKDKAMAIVHCGAGISRSGAVGTFIHSLYEKNDPMMTYDEFKRKNPRIMPNSYVLRLLNNQLRKDKSI
jgi:predicted protein tyrosine phosphatase